MGFAPWTFQRTLVGLFTTRIRKMPISIQQLLDEITPERTVLIFGAGASAQCDAPSVADLIARIVKDFGIQAEGLTLAEISGLAEHRRNRHELIKSLRDEFKNVRGKGAILNLPLYNWKSIFTTNYDEVVEDVYARRKKPLITFSSNFDFTVHNDPNATKYLKLHGTIGKDVVDGHSSRIILSDRDYDMTLEYREALYLRFSAELLDGSNVVVIGHGLPEKTL